MKKESLKNYGIENLTWVLGNIEIYVHAQRKIFVKNKQTKEPETTLNCYLRLIFRLCTKRKERLSKVGNWPAKDKGVLQQRAGVQRLREFWVLFSLISIQRHHATSPNQKKKDCRPHISMNTFFTNIDYKTH